MASKKPRASVEALHRAIQHHVQVEEALGELHRALIAEDDRAGAVAAVRAKSEGLALAARLLELRDHLESPGGQRRTRAWRKAQLARLDRERR